MSNQELKAGDNSKNTQIGHNQYIATGGAIHVKEQNDKARIEFIENSFKAIAIIILSVIAFITNPSADNHIKQIRRGEFSDYQLDRELFYDNYLLYSSMYVIGKDGQQIVFSWGVFGKIIETSDYNYNQQRLHKINMESVVKAAREFKRIWESK